MAMWIFCVRNSSNRSSIRCGDVGAAGLVLFALTFIVNAAARTVVNNRK